MWLKDNITTIRSCYRLPPVARKYSRLTITIRVAGRLRSLKAHNKTSEIVAKWCQKKELRQELFSVWCRHEESNHGPTDYKSVALPTELRRRCKVALCPPIGVRIIGFYSTSGKGFWHEFSGLVGSGASSLIAQHDLFLTIFFNHGASSLAWGQTDIDEKDRLIARSRRDVRLQVE